MAALGYSDNWEDFTLCEVMKTHFGLYGVSPVIFVNVLDPAEHKESVESAEIALVDGRAELPETAIKSTVVVKAASAGDALVEGTDYSCFYNDGKLIVEAIKGGALSGSSAYIAYDKVKPSGVDSDDIIGGIDVSTGAKKGLELVNSVFTKYGVVPEFIIAPGYSSDNAVAAVMAAKADSICGLFKGKAIIDADCTTIKKYSDVYGWLAASGEEAVVDYLCPQIYWGYGYQLQSGSTRFAFENIVPEWLGMARAANVALYFGLGAYRVGVGDGGANEDSTSQWATGSALARQVADLRRWGAQGWALYRYDSLFGPAQNDLAAAERAALAEGNG